MRIYTILKCTSDIVLSFLALIILSPVFLIAAIGIFISSPGNVFYSARRIGENGKPFTMFKFRTMYKNKEKGHVITLRTDKRIFPFGAFLRKSKIDELPQLVNILMGKMSIVGWRPEDEENAEKVFVGAYKEILTIKPGLTSPGSLYDYTHGERFDDEVSYEKEFLPQKMNLELYYVKHRSVQYDMNILFRTIKIIVLTILGKENFPLPKEIEKL